MPPTKSPGPANYTMRPLIGYKDHDPSSTKRRGPQWTVGPQHGNGVENKSPGPAAYTLEKLTRSGPVAIVGGTMFKRTKDLRSDPNPGPRHDAVNLSLYKQRNPRYSVRIKTKELRLDSGPGPQSEPTPLDLYKNRMPKYPMLKKHDALPMGEAPAPNAYNAGEAKMRVLNQDPAYSLKVLVGGIQKDKTPAPNSYDLMKLNPFPRYPAYSMRRKFCDYVHVPVLPMDNCA